MVATSTRVNGHGTSQGATVIPGASDARYAFAGRATGNQSHEVGAPAPGARSRLAAEVGLGDDQLVGMRQVHGDGVAVVDRSDAAAVVPDVDALVTTEKDLGLVVLVADCVPVLLGVPGAGVAAVHAGHPGVRARIVPAAVAVLAAATGRAPVDVRAVVGPAIGPCCYEVPADMRARFAARVDQVAASTTWGTPSLDLPSAVSAQLRAAGVTAISRAGACTRCERGEWFSHRATTGIGAPAGRNAGIVRRVSGASRPSSASPPGGEARDFLH